MSFARIAPVLFVLIYSTGWVVAKLAAPHADPLAFLVLRFAGAIALLVPLALALGGRWPRGPKAWGAALVNGALLHGGYLGCVWWAVAHGVPAGVSALIAALQPVFTALAAGPLLGERLDAKRWAGVALGVAGVGLVVAPKLSAGAGELGGLAWPLAVNVLAMVSITAATLHQKRSLGGSDIRTLSPAQYLGALIAVLAVFPFLGEPRFDLVPENLIALAWSVLALSIGAIFLMLAMIERGEVSRVSALIFLVPPVAVLEAWLLFGETLSGVQVAGMAVAAAGVLLANAGQSAASAEGCIAAEPPDGEDKAETFSRPA